MDENALVDMQMRLLHNERAIEELNAALSDQQAQIAGIARSMEFVIERLRELGDVPPAGAAGDERPPHY